MLRMSVGINFKFVSQLYPFLSVFSIDLAFVTVRLYNDGKRPLFLDLVSYLQKPSVLMKTTERRFRG